MPLAILSKSALSTFSAPLRASTGRISLALLFVFSMTLSVQVSAIPEDSDNDGIFNADDAFPDLSIGTLIDTDYDGAPDECDEACVALGMTADTDDDGDGVPDDDDLFPQSSLNRTVAVPLGLDIPQTGELTMSADGFTIVVADQLSDTTQPDESVLADTGSVRVFDYVEGAWTQRGETLSGAAAGDQAGAGVALSADGLTLAVGYPGEDTFRGVNYGIVRVFTWDGSAWTQRGTDIRQSGLATISDFGRLATFDASGDILVVSNGSSLARFEWDGADWTIATQRHLAHPQGASIDLSADGQYVLLPMYCRDNTCTENVLRRWNGTGWDSPASSLTYIKDGYYQSGIYLCGGTSGYGAHDRQRTSTINISADGSRMFFGCPYGGSAKVWSYDEATDAIAPVTDFGNITTSGAAWNRTLTTDLSAAGTTYLLSSPGYVRESDGSNIGRIDVHSGVGRRTVTAFGNTGEQLGYDHGTDEGYRSIALNWDGRRFAAQTQAGVTRVFEIQDGEPFGPDIDNDGAPNECDLECRAAGLFADDDDDGDGLLDVDDPDADGDGVTDTVIPDSDSDGIADDFDTDRDNDGIFNADDAFPDLSIGTLIDTDYDGAPDECDEACVALGMTADTDDDGDGVPDDDDLFPQSSLNRTVAVPLGLDIPQTGELTMSADGFTIVVADQLSDTTQPDESVLADTGSVRVFDYVEGAWTQRGETLSGAAAGDQAGAGVALSADGLTLAVGYPGEDTFRGVNYGIVRVFTWDGSAWTQRGTDIRQSGLATISDFGRLATFDASGDILVVSNGSSLARFEWDGADWTIATQRHLAHPQGASIDLSADGQYVLLPMYCRDNTCTENVLRRWNGTGWDSPASSLTYIKDGYYQSGIYLCGGTSGYGAHDRQRTSTINISADGSRMFFGCPYGGSAKVWSYDEATDAIAPVTDFGNITTSGAAWNRTLTTDLSAAGTTYLLSSPGYVRESDGSNIGRIDVHSGVGRRTVTAFGNTGEQLGYDHGTDEGYRSIALNWDGRRFAAQTQAGVTRVFEIQDGEPFGPDIDNDGAPNECDLECRAAGLFADDDDDGDGLLDVDDPDADGDGVTDTVIPDSDSDGIADDFDTDRDNDGIFNADDAFPDLSIGTLIDTDYDGAPDECDEACVALGMTADTDDDGDGVPDDDDLFPQSSLNRTVAVPLGLDIPQTGELTMSADGFTIVVADQLSDTTQPDESVLADTGSVRVFDYVEGAWTQRGETLSGAAAGDQAGAGVALSADGLTLAVGYPGEDTFRGVNYGIVRVFTWDGSAWTQRGTDIRQSGLATISDFGRLATFDASGDILVVSNGSSLARFEWDGADWTIATQRHLAHPQGASIDLSADGQYVLLPMYCRDNTCTENVLRRWNGTGWDSPASSLTYIKDGYYQSGIYLCGGTSGYGAHDRQRTSTINISADGSRMFFGCPYGGSAKVWSYDEATDAIAPVTDFGNITTSGAAWNRTLTTDLSAAGTTYLLSSPGYVRESDGSNIGRIDVHSGVGRRTVTAFGNTGEQLGYDHGTDEGYRSIALNWDGRRFAAQTQAGVTRVFEIQDGEPFGPDIDNDGAPNECDLECRAAGLFADDDDDGDGLLDVDDPDADGDGVTDTVIPDSDSDGIADDFDTDRDNDGIFNADDAFPDLSIGTLIDTDYDGAPDECDEACVALGMTADTDDDGDGVPDDDDLFPQSSLNRTVAVPLGLDIPQTGELTMSADGFTIVVADQLSDTTQPDESVLADTGSVRVFDYVEGAWTQRGETLSGAAAGDQAGAGVALSADGLTLAVGYPGEDTFRGVNYGIVRVFTWDGSAWTQRGTDIRQSGLATISDFGRLATFDASGDILVVSNGSSLARFEWDGADWTIATQRHLAHPQGASIDLSADGQYVLLPMYCRDNTCTENVLRRWNGTGWDSPASSLTYIKDGYYQSGIYLCGGTSGYGAHDRQRTSTINISADGSRMFFGCPYGGSAKVWSYDEATDAIAPVTDFGNITTSGAAWNRTLTTDLSAAGTTYLLSSPGYVRESDGSNIGRIDVHSGVGRRTVTAFGNTGEQLGYDHGTDEGYRSIALNWDGRRFAAQTQAGVTRVFEIQDGEPFGPDIDNDGAPNECDLECLDAGLELDIDNDNDGVNDNEDTYPLISLDGRPDSDGDGIPDDCDDVCRATGMVDDPDNDDDGVLDDDDVYPSIPLGNRPDNDGDGAPDTCDTACQSTGMLADPDDDNDGQLDTDEQSCGSDPFDALSLSVDTDKDTIPNCVDPDDDNDGLSDIQEPSAGTDPLKFDTDFDGLSDLFERNSGRNPVVADYHLAAGWEHVCASNDTGVTCWGDNSTGQGDVPAGLGVVNQLSLGGYYSCALDSKGAVTCWGTAPDVSSLVGPQRAITAGGGHLCAISEQGNVACVGNNAYGQTDVPALSNPQQVIAGSEFSCALDDNGVTCWGGLTPEEVTVPTLLNPTAIYGKFNYACAKDDSGLVCWGTEYAGRLQPPALSADAIIELGRDHACAIDDGDIVCWGNNFQGATEPPSLSNPVQLAIGVTPSCALSEMAIDCWGDPLGASGVNANIPESIRFGNYDGDEALDDVDNDDDNDGVSDSFDKFPRDETETLDNDNDGIGDNADADDDNDGQTDESEIACGSDPLDAGSRSPDADGDSLPNCVDPDDDNDGVNDTEDVFPFNAEEWYDTDEDGIGNNADTDDDGDGQLDADELSCGSDPLDAESMSLDTDGDSIPDCVDDDDDGDSVPDSDDTFPLDPLESSDFDGDGTGDNADLDDDNDGQSDIDEVSCGSNPNDSSSLALDTDGDLRPNCVDTDDDGDGISDIEELASGLNPLRVDSDFDSLSDPFELATGRNAGRADYTMAAGWNHVCAIDDTGVNCWGDNRNGQTEVPEELDDVIALTAGARFSCSLDTTGVARCWGVDPVGDDLPDDLLSISAGANHVCGISASQGVVCEGANSFGQTEVPSLFNPVAVTAGTNHSCALDDNGVTCWGGTADVVVNVPALSNPTGVYTKHDFSCATDDTGVVCWGPPYAGRTTPPALPSDVFVEVGRDHACATDGTSITCWGNNYFGATQPPELSKPVQLAIGVVQSCALSDEGLSCWGAAIAANTPPEGLRFGDYDGDGLRDDVDPDDDGDGVEDEDDAFPFDETESLDTDGDGIGNNADVDDDNDLQLDVDEEACGSDPLDAGSLSPDADGDHSPDCVDTDDDNDGVLDLDDAFPLDPTESADTDGDGVGNNTDRDDDGDNVLDDDDLFPLDSTEWDDFDGDGTGDNADADDDNDGQPDTDEQFCGTNPRDAESFSPDSDGDGTNDCLDFDDDNDGVDDPFDAFPLDPAESEDFDFDGIGDNADIDDDNDGQSDEDEIACGSDPLSSRSLSQDTDGDSIPDCVDADDDGDGQSDEAENACGSDPLATDSTSTDTDTDGMPDCVDDDDDGDGFSDDEEAQRGTDPLDALSYPQDEEEEVGGMNLLLIKAALDARSAKSIQP